jgi:hypothetical protein
MRTFESSSSYNHAPDSCFQVTDLQELLKAKGLDVKVGLIAPCPAVAACHLTCSGRAQRPFSWRVLWQPLPLRPLPQPLPLPLPLPLPPPPLPPPPLPPLQLFPLPIHLLLPRQPLPHLPLLMTRQLGCKDVWRSSACLPLPLPLPRQMLMQRGSRNAVCLSGCTARYFTFCAPF